MRPASRNSPRTATGSLPPVNKKLIELAERRAALVAKAENQRGELAQAFEPWRAPLGIADRGVAVLRFIFQHKAVAIGVFAFLIALRPKLASAVLRSGWMGKALVIWRAVMAVKRALGG